MKKLLLVSYCLFFSSIICAQVKIAPNTVITGGAQAVFTTGTSINNESSLVNLPVLQLENSASISTSQNLIISSGLRLFSGRISFTGTGKVLYSGEGGNISYDENNYIISGFYALGGGNKTYPVGTSSELAEAEMLITGADGSFISKVNVYNEDIALDPAILPTGIDAASQNWYWEFIAEGSYTNVRPSVSVNNPDNLLIDPSSNLALVVLEVDAGKTNIKKLGRGGASNDAIVRAADNGIGPFFLLGITKDVRLVINQVITPNHDGVNDKLEIENLDVFAGTYEILLLDRYGGIVWRSTSLHEDDINFEFLEPGNYICIVNYPADEPAKQMVTVIK